jgi:hypothetical protein
MRTSSLAALTVIGVTVLSIPGSAQDLGSSSDLSRELGRRADALAEQIAGDSARARQFAEFLARQAADLAARARTQESSWARELSAQLARQAREFAQQAERLVQGVDGARGGRRGQDQKGPEVTEAFSRRVPLGRDGTFSLENVAGTIVVIGGGDMVRIDAVKRARGANEAAARSLLRQLQIFVTERGDSVEVRTAYPARMRTSGSGVDYKVNVPNGAHVTLKSVSGDVSVKSINGELRAETVSGNIDASAVRLVRQAKSMTGTIHLSDASGAEVNAGTVSGDILLRSLKARNADLQSVSGNLRMTDVDIERAHSRSMSGAIEYAGRIARGGRYEFQSHFGDVRVVPAGSTGFDVEANTFSGDIRSDYALRLFRRTSPGRGVPVRFTRTVRGSFGDGGATLAIQSFSGNIVIVKQ